MPFQLPLQSPLGPLGPHLLAPLVSVWLRLHKPAEERISPFVPDVVMGALQTAFSPSGQPFHPERQPWSPQGTSSHPQNGFATWRQPRSPWRLTFTGSLRPSKAAHSALVQVFAAKTPPESKRGGFEKAASFWPGWRSRLLLSKNTVSGMAPPDPARQVGKTTRLTCPRKHFRQFFRANHALSNCASTYSQLMRFSTNALR